MSYKVLVVDDESEIADYMVIASSCYDCCIKAVDRREFIGSKLFNGNYDAYVTRKIIYDHFCRFIWIQKYDDF